MAEERDVLTSSTAGAEEVPMDEQTLQELQHMLAVDVRQVDAPDTLAPQQCCGLDK